MSVGIYGKYILPRLLDRVMRDQDIEKERRQLIPDATGVVIEIGFGSGLNLPFYRGITKLYAVDPSGELWKLAKEGVQNTSFPVEFIHAGAEELPFQDQSIDTVVSTWSLCSVAYPAKVLNEIKRVLKPAGTFICIEHGKSSEPSIAAWQTRLTPLWRMFAGGCHLNRDVPALLIQAGFGIENLQRGYERTARLKLLQYFYKGIVSQNKTTH